MKYVARQADALLFELEPREKLLLVSLLRQYPKVPVAYHRVTRGAMSAETIEAQQLLSQDIAAQQEEERRRLKKWLADSRRFEKAHDRFRLRIAAEDLDWLLRILNDVRVGSWISLGSPSALPTEADRVSPDRAPLVLAMEFCGFVQWNLLQAVK